MAITKKDDGLVAVQSGFPVSPVLTSVTNPTDRPIPVQIVEGTVPAGTVQDPLISSSTGAGTVSAGANSVSIGNIGGAIGTVKGVDLPVGVSVNWSASPGGTLSAVAYDATGTKFLITEVNWPVDRGSACGTSSR